MSCRQKGSGSRLHLHFGVRRHLALLVHYSVLDRASSTPHAPGGGCAPPALARFTATPRTDLAPACRPELPCGPQCGAARGYVKVLALHSACASGAHARARRAHTVCLCAAFLLNLGILVPKTAIFFRSAGLKRALARLRLARFLTRQKGLNHVPLAHPDRGLSQPTTTKYGQIDRGLSQPTTTKYGQIDYRRLD